MLLNDLKNQGLIDPPRIVLENTAYLCRMGSESYGASLGDDSDVDVVGFAIPRKTDLFPYSHGFVLGFGTVPQPFQSWTKHHVKASNTEFDFTIYSIVKFFHLAMTSSPNQIDSLFVPDRCVIHATEVGKLVRDNRKMFLHKGAMAKLRGYAFSQMKKIKEKQGSGNEKRQATIDAHGYDTKHAYHCIRLCLQAEQILEEHELTLDRNSKMLLSIRRGEWSFEQLEDWFHVKEQSLEVIYARSTLQHSPDEDAIKTLLMKCLESHYGNLQNAVVVQTDSDKLMAEMQSLIDRYKR